MREVQPPQARPPAAWASSNRWRCAWAWCRTRSSRASAPQLVLFASDHGLGRSTASACPAAPRRPSWWPPADPARNCRCRCSRAFSSSTVVVDCGIADDRWRRTRTLLAQDRASARAVRASPRRCRSIRRMPPSAPAWRSPIRCPATRPPAPASAWARESAALVLSRLVIRRCGTCCSPARPWPEDLNHLVNVLSGAGPPQGRSRPGGGAGLPRRLRDGDDGRRDAGGRQQAQPASWTTA